MTEFSKLVPDRLPLHSLPTRRSSDLQVLQPVATTATPRGPAGPGRVPGVLPRRSPDRPGRPCPHRRDGVATGGTRRSDRKSTRLNSSHVAISYAVFCLKKKETTLEDV